jgi:redox-sensitive bicupin YhaK (pirin superfamily)
MTKPGYQEVKAAEIPVVADKDGAQVHVICGRYGDTRGPVKGVAAEPEYLDISLPSGLRKSFPISEDRNVFAYVFEGSGTFAETTIAENRSLVLFGPGDEVIVQAGQHGVRFLLVSGKPLREPVAWHGPIVMNTQDELRQAFRELDNGTFLKHGS